MANPIVESARCGCEKPEPTGGYIAGAFQLCAKCKKIANWREFEDEIKS
jgi:hypothetical protein